MSVPELPIAMELDPSGPLLPPYRDTCRGAIVNVIIRRILANEPEPLAPDSNEMQAILKNKIITCRNYAKSALPASGAQNVDRKLDELIINAYVEAIRIKWRLFPINRFPVEILTQIFNHVSWSASEPQEGVLNRMRLTWVCKWWRETALSHQALWNTIWFSDRFPYHRSLLFLERAGTSPIDIRINEHIRFYQTNRDPEEEITAERMAWAMDRILTKADQIRRLFILAESWSTVLAAQAKLQNPPRPMVQLQHLEIHRTGTFNANTIDDDESNPYLRVMVLCGGYAPKLTHLTLNGTHIDWINSPPSNLTSLDLRRNSVRGMPRIDHFQNILRACPNIKRLCLDGAAALPMNGLQLGVPAPITLPTLDIFSIGDFSLSYSIYICSVINAPNVRDLTLQNLNAEDFGYFLESITGKFPQVQILCLTAFEVGNRPEMTRILCRWYNSMPKVTFLRLRQITPQILEALNTDYRLHMDDSIPLNPTFEQYEKISYGPGHFRVLLPDLATFEFSFIIVDLVIRYTHMRINVNKPLRRILVEKRWCDVLPMAAKEKIKALAQVFSTRMVPLMSHTDLGSKSLTLAAENIRQGSRLGPPTP